MKLLISSLLLLFKEVFSNNALVLVDMQKCFLNELPIYGATLNYDEVAEKIENNIYDIDHITLIKNSHNNSEINNKLNWINSTGHHPQDYQEINIIDIGRKWWPLSISIEYAKNYSTELYKNNKNPIIIWPEHCTIGTQGHETIDTINEVLNKWENTTNKKVVIIEKGLNFYSEEYGILPEVRLIESIKNLNMSNVQKVINIILNYDNITIIGDQYSPSTLPIFYDFHEIMLDWLKLSPIYYPKINLNVDLLKKLEENTINAIDWIKNKIKNTARDFFDIIFNDEL